MTITHQILSSFGSKTKSNQILTNQKSDHCSICRSAKSLYPLISMILSTNPFTYRCNKFQTKDFWVSWLTHITAMLAWLKQTCQVDKSHCGEWKPLWCIFVNTFTGWTFTGHTLVYGKLIQVAFYFQTSRPKWPDLYQMLNRYTTTVFLCVMDTLVFVFA